MEPETSITASYKRISFLKFAKIVRGLGFYLEMKNGRKLTLLLTVYLILGSEKSSIFLQKIFFFITTAVKYRQSYSKKAFTKILIFV